MARPPLMSHFQIFVRSGKIARNTFQLGDFAGELDNGSNSVVDEMFEGYERVVCIL
jgi:hypothetical protein